MADLSGVLLVGGSSRMPAVAELVSAATGLPTLIDADPKLVVAAGAAWPRGVGGGEQRRGRRQRPEERERRTRRRRCAPARPAPPGSAAAARRSERLRRAVCARGGHRSRRCGGRRRVLRLQAVVGRRRTAEALGPEDGEMSDAEAELFATGLAEELFSELASEAGPDSLDAFDVPVGLRPASAPTVLRWARPSGRRWPVLWRWELARRTVGRWREQSLPSRPAPRQHRRPDAGHAERPDRPWSTSRPATVHHSGPSATTRPATSSRTRSSTACARSCATGSPSLSLPDGTDPADATKLRNDLEGLLDRFRPYPGQYAR